MVLAPGTPSPPPVGGNGGQHNGPPGGGQNRPRAGERANEAWQNQKAGFYYAVADTMLKTGFTPEQIGKVGSGNFCCVFDAATSGHA